MIKLIDLVENDTVPSEEKRMQNFLYRGSRDQNKEWEPQRMQGRKGTIEEKSRGIDDMSIEQLNSEYTKLNKKYLKNAQLQRKFADQKDWNNYDKQIEVLDLINDKMMQISSTLEKKEDEAKRNKSNRFAEGPLTVKHPENTNSSQRYNNGYPSNIVNADPNIFEDESEVDKIHQALIGREFQSLNDVGKMASRLRQAGYAQSEIEALVQNYIM